MALATAVDPCFRLFVFMMQAQNNILDMKKTYEW